MTRGELAQASRKQIKEHIAEMIASIDDRWILETIHKFIVGMTKKGDAGA